MQVPVYISAWVWNAADMGAHLLFLFGRESIAGMNMLDRVICIPWKDGGIPFGYMDSIAKVCEQADVFLQLLRFRQNLCR